MSFAAKFVVGVLGWSFIFATLYFWYWAGKKAIRKIRGSDDDDDETTDDDSGFVTRRKVLAGSAIVGLSTLGALVPDSEDPEASADTSDDPEPEPEPSDDGGDGGDDKPDIELRDHWFNVTQWAVEMGLEIRNNTGSASDAYANIELFSGDERLDSGGVRFNGLGGGLTESKVRTLRELSPDEFDDITHYTIETGSQGLFGGSGATYDFDADDIQRRETDD
ncbi:hypothetical protein [Natrinema gelatinilyticum]|uniref:hypothetical protein n=1 Tax=Natrinema gelatinilyticum TaxID=2961571 RepID=UPI0020C22481|nr:hypothetical protein [Natrinema gelatinilyticum]